MMETMYFVEGDDGFVWVLVFKKMYKMLLTFVIVDWGLKKKKKGDKSFLSSFYTLNDLLFEKIENFGQKKKRKGLFS